MDAVITFLQTLVVFIVHIFDLLIQLAIYVFSFFLVVARMILTALHLI